MPTNGHRNSAPSRDKQKAADSQPVEVWDQDAIADGEYNDRRWDAFRY